MTKPFIIYLRNKNSTGFEYKKDVSKAVRIDKVYRITFNSGKYYNYAIDNVRYYQHISTRENVFIYEDGKLNRKYNIVDNYGKYLILRNEHSYSDPIENNSCIEIYDVKQDTDRRRSIIEYLKNILTVSGETSFDMPSDDPKSKNANQISSEILLKALDRIDINEPRSALSKYLDGTNPTLAQSGETLIYPFGCNESQKLAVETSLSNSISIIEGPPGTGKTQTILNIIANLIIQGKSVAIVSNNNSAVFNIREKLEKYGYGRIVASLGNNENIQSFFDSQKRISINHNSGLTKGKLNEAKNRIKNLDVILTQCFQYRNRLAILKTQLADTEIEFEHIQSEQKLSETIKVILDKKFYRK